MSLGEVRAEVVPRANARVAITRLMLTNFRSYGMLDLTAYTHDLNGDSTGRVYGGGGVRGSIPFTRIYSDVQSDLFNLCGINHKIVLGGNYYIAKSNEPSD